MYEITFYDKYGHQVDFMVAHDRESANYARDTFTPEWGTCVILEVK